MVAEEKGLSFEGWKSLDELEPTNVKKDQCSSSMYWGKVTSTYR